VDQINAQVNKRAKKLNELSKEIPQPVLLGPEQAEVTLVSWGSTVNVLQELLVQVENSVNVIHLPCVWPFPKEKFTQLASKAQKLVMVEGNHTGQAEQLMRQETGIEFADRLRRFDGRPFYWEEILDWLAGLN